MVKQIGEKEEFDLILNIKENKNLSQGGRAVVNAQSRIEWWFFLSQPFGCLKELAVRPIVFYSYKRLTSKK